MRTRWMGAALLALGLAGRAAAQMPGPPPGAGGPLPMYQPTFAGEPSPVPAPQFCPPGGGEPPPSPFSLPNDGSPNAFSCVEPEGCGGPGLYVNIGWMALTRQTLGNGVLAVKDPGSHLANTPSNADTGNGPGSGAPGIFGFNDIVPGTSNGVRASVIWREGENAFEIGGFYMFSNTGTGFAAAPGQLDLPFAAYPSPIGFQGDNFLWLQADRILATFESTLASAEANYRHVLYPGFEWIFGVRYVDLKEDFRITTDDDGLVLRQQGLPVNLMQVATVYSQTRNRIVAPQIGVEWERLLVSWLSLGFTGKAALGANFSNTTVGLVRGDGFMGPSATRNQTLFSQVYDLSVWGTVKITDQWRIKAGYQALWIAGIPESQQQFNFNLAHPDWTFNHNGSAFYHGPMVEMQFSF